MDKKQILNQLIDKGYAQYASWALYDVSNKQLERRGDIIHKKNLSFAPFKNNIVENINLNGMFLGLNCGARDSMKEDWSNFHDTRKDSQDYKIAYMIKNTKFEGCYMTDLFKNFAMNDSNKTIEAIQLPENKEKYDLSIKLFQFEYDLIKPKSIICFGEEVKEALVKLAENKEIEISENVKIIQLRHYSDYLSIEDCKKEKAKLA